MASHGFHLAFGLVSCLANVVHAVKRSWGAGEYVMAGGFVVLGVGMLIAAPRVWPSSPTGTIIGGAGIVVGLIRFALQYRKDRARRPE